MASKDFTYHWTALDRRNLDAQGRPAMRSGKMPASSEGSVGVALRDQGLEPVDISAKANSFGGKEFSFSKIMGKPSPKAMAHAYRQLATLSRNGVSLPEAVESVAGGNSDMLVREVFSDVRDRLNDGETLDQAMSRYPKVFAEVEISLLRAAQTAGNVDQTLERIATMVENANAIAKKIRGALMMPAVTILGVVVVAMIMATQLMPTMAAMLEDVAPDAEMPLPTRIVMWFGDNALWLVPSIVIGGVGMWLFESRVLSRDEGYRIWKSKAVLKVPVAGMLVSKMSVARLSRGMEMMLNAGVAQSQALRILGPTMGNLQYREAVAAMEAGIMEGLPLSKVLINYSELFDFQFIKMVEVGERSGSLVEMFTSVADEMEEDVKATTDAMSDLLGPLVMIVIGLMLSVLGLAMYGPITAISSNL